MSYEVIARRWRPLNFNTLVGQDHIRTTLLNALKHQRLHHALIFTGPRGTGKTSTARILAKTLRCQNQQDFTPCNQCSECTEISSGRSVNVIEIDGASNNGVDAIRELRDTVGYMPSSGLVKMYIIDEVHMLSTSAFNALLKTLEEPPPHVYFVMATTEIQKVPNTILSRCQRFDFRRISTRVIADHLKTICEQEKYQFDVEALWLMARQSDGSMRDAQSLLDQVINFTDGHLKNEAIVRVLGLTDRGLLHDILQAMTAGQVDVVIDKIKDLHQNGGDPKLFLLDLMNQLRHALLIKLNGGPHALVDLPDSEQQRLIEINKTLAAEDLHWFFDMALKGAQDLVRAADPLLVLEMVLLRMTTAPRLQFLRTIASSTAKVGVATAPQSPEAATPVVTAMTSSTSNGAEASRQTASAATFASGDNSIALRFQGLVGKLKEINGLMGAQLENCQVESFTQKNLLLGISGKHKFLFEKMNQADFKKKVTNYVNSFWGPGHTVQFQLNEADANTSSPKALNEHQQSTRQEEIRQSVEANPNIRIVQNILKGEIKSIRPMQNETPKSEETNL